MKAEVKEEVKEEEKEEPKEEVKVPGGSQGMETRKKLGHGPLSIGIRAGINTTPNVRDLIILRSGAIYQWEFKQQRYMATLISSLNLTDHLSLEGGFGRALATDLDYWFLSLGPRFYPVHYKAFSPYLRAGVLWGSLSWDEIPGDFEESFGFEGGVGLEYFINRCRLGAEMSYRNVKFQYNPPPGVLSNQDNIDFSGFSIMGEFIYFF
jgi:hypothetical protein